MRMYSDDERDQQNGDGSDNDEDEVMEDADADADPDEDDDEEADNDADDNDDDNDDEADDNDQDEDSQQPARRSRSSTQPPVRPLPKLRPGADTAVTYDIVPYVAAPQSTSINAFTATPCMRWVFTGGSDGYIRRYDWFGSMNGKVPLTVAQKHPFVDSVTRAGMLLSYWENEEPSGGGAARSSLLHVPETTDDLKLSPVYSLAVQDQSLWLLSGLESGGINLQSVRHDEGKIITTLRKHKSAVSVLTLAQDERSVLSGSWDGSVFDWDLNTGTVVREYSGTSGQISSIGFRSYAGDSAWDEIRKEPLINGVSSGAGRSSGTANSGMLTNGTAPAAAANGDGGEADAPGSPESSHSFASLFGETDDMGMNGDGDEMNQAIVNGLGDGPPPSSADDPAPPAAAAAAAAAPTAPSAPSSQTLSSGGRPSSPHLPAGPTTSSSGPTSDQNTFLVSSMDGILRLWDRRAPTPAAISHPSKGVPPWCMQSVWSTDGNYVYAGRRNGSVDEYSLRMGLSEPARNFRFPLGSGSVSALCAMPNGRHLICASFDNLRLYDLKHVPSKGNTVPFLIIPGHHGGVVSNIFVDRTCSYLVSLAGNRGWEGANTEVWLGYEIAF